MICAADTAANDKFWDCDKAATAAGTPSMPVRIPISLLVVIVAI
jgi:hypothetical protein